MSIEKRYTIDQISKLDSECRSLVNMFSAARIKIGLELAKRLKDFEQHKLYLRLDSESYPNFARYLESLDIKYKTAREIIGLYECYVLEGGKDIDELAKIGYHKLTLIKPLLFRKEGDKYELTKPKSELNKWLTDAKSDMTQEDLMQLRRESEVGEHSHDWDTVCYDICRICKLKELRVHKHKISN